MYQRISEQALIDQMDCRLCGRHLLYSDTRDFIWCAECGAFNGILVVDQAVQLVLPMGDEGSPELPRRSSQQVEVPNQE